MATSFQSKVTTKSSQPSFASKIKPVTKEPAGKGLSARIWDDLAGRGQNVDQTFQKNQGDGALGLARTALNIVGQGAGFIGDIGTEVIKSGVGKLPSNVKEGAKQFGVDVLSTHIGKAGVEAIKSGAESYESFKKTHPDTAQALEDVLNITAILPVGKGVAVIGEGAAKGAGLTAKGVGAGVTSTGRGVAATGKAIAESAIRPTVQEAERMLAYEAKQPFLKRAGNVVKGVETEGKPTTRATTAFDYGIFGTEKGIGIKAKRAADAVWNQKIAPAVKNSTAVVTKEDMFAPIRERINSVIEPGRKQALIDAFEVIDDEYKDVVEFSIEQAQQVKRELDQFTPTKIFKGKEVANEYRTLQNDMANAIRTKTYESLSDINIKKAYLDWANLNELEKVGVRAITDGGKLGGFGGFWTSMFDAAVTPVKTVGGRVLYNVGNKLQFIGDKGIKTFGQFLRKQGYSPITPPDVPKKGK